MYEGIKIYIGRVKLLEILIKGEYVNVIMKYIKIEIYDVCYILVVLKLFKETNLKTNKLFLCSKYINSFIFYYEDERIYYCDR